MIKRLLPLLFLLSLVMAGRGATVFPPATQPEVNAGTLHSKFVAPDTLKGFGTFMVTNAGFVNLTNIQPFSGHLYMNPGAVEKQQVFTNFTRLWTNRWSGSVATNVTVNVATTNGYIIAPSNGLYNLSFFINYRNQTNIGLIRTNFFAITTNAGGVGTNVTQVISSDVMASTTTRQSVAGDGLIYLPANTYVALGYWTTGVINTNEMVIEYAGLSMNMAPNSFLGNITSGGSFSGPASQFSGSTIKDGAATTNLQNFTSFKNTGTLTNTGDLINGQNITAARIFASTGVRSESIINTNGTDLYGVNRLGGTNYLTNSIIPLATASRVTMVDANGMLTNVTSAAPSTDYVHADGTVGTPAGSVAGNSGAIQFVEGTSPAGTNDFTFNRSNTFLLIQGVNTAVELGAQQSGGVSHLRTTNNSAMYFGTWGTNQWGIAAIDSGANRRAGDIIPIVGSGSIGDGLAPVKVFATNISATIYSNQVYDLPGASSTVTLYSTNQFWRCNVTSNLTFADDGALFTNVVYWMKVTNNASTITWPGTWRWLDGPTVSTAPTLQGGEFVLRVQKFDDTTNAWVEVGKQFLLAPGLNVNLGTNTTAGIITNGLNQGLTNITAINFDYNTWLIPTNNALSNLVVNFGITNNLDVYITNNITLTNWTGLAAGNTASKTMWVYPQLVTRGVNWGNLGGGINPGYNVAIWTNANNTLWTTLTNGKSYVISIVAKGTNLYPTITLWE